ncbi:MAG: hypothetical protein RJA07_1340 [Bacteroidota bacterium]|jgi:hypothetical protein
MKQKKSLSLLFLLAASIVIGFNCKRIKQYDATAETPNLPSQTSDYSINVSALSSSLNTDINARFNDQTGSMLNTTM